MALQIPGVGQTQTTNALATGRRAPRVNAMAPAASPFATSGAQLTAYGPNNDLRGTSILPTDSARTTTASGQADTAYGQLAGFTPPTWNTVGPYSSRNSMDGIQRLSTMPVQGADFGESRGMLGGAMTAANGFTNQAASMLGGVGGVSFNGGAASQTALDAKGLIPTGDVYRDDTGQVRKLALDRVSNLTAPDRQKLAEESLALLEERSRGSFEQAQRQLGQKAAALGRIGSGMTTTGLSDLGLARERELALSRRELANETAGLRLSDELDQLGATQSVFGSFTGADLSEDAAKVARAQALLDAGGLQLGVAEGESRAQQANADVGLRRASQMADLGNDTFGRGATAAGMATDWENARTGLGERNEDRRLGVGRTNLQLDQDAVNFRENADRFGYTSGVNERDSGFRAQMDTGDFLSRRAQTLGTREGQMRGVDAANRDELRGERGFQNDMARASQQDRINMAQFAQWLQTQNLGNAQGLFGTGQTGNVGGAYQSIAGAQGAQAGSAYDAAGQLASVIPFLANRGRATGGSGGVPFYSSPTWG